MKNAIASIVALAGLSAAASADVNTRVDILVSANGIDFGPSVVFNPGTGLHKVEVLVRATYIGASEALGLASMVFQPTVSNWGATDQAGAYANGGFGSNTSVPAGVVPDAPGAYGRISPFGRTNLTSSQAITNFVHAPGQNGNINADTRLRIAQRQVTAWIGGSGNTTGGSGVNIAQLANVGRTASDPAFNPALSVNVFRFSITVDTSPAGFGRADLVVDAPLDGFGNRNSTTGEREVYWWDTASINASSGGNRGTAIVNHGHISIPAPTSLALLGLGGLCVARRRR